VPDLSWVRDLAPSILPGEELVEIEELRGGEVNETVRVATTSGKRFVVRRAPENVADWYATIPGQVATMELARGVGVPVPEVVSASERILVYRYVEGTPIAPSACEPHLARAVGHVHGRLHGVRGDGCGPVQVDGRSPGWSGDVAFRDVRVWADRLLVLPDPNPLSTPDVEAAAELLSAYAPAPASRLLHGDASPGNTIVDRGEIASLIDFDDAWYADPAVDMAWWWWNDPPTGDAFATGCVEASGERADPLTIWSYRVRLLLGIADTFAVTNVERTQKVARLLPYAVAELRRAIR
jgi:aminoglycoside phosphotransferase (APT) family kinase protein